MGWPTAAAPEQHGHGPRGGPDRRLPRAPRLERRVDGHVHQPTGGRQKRQHGVGCDGQVGQPDGRCSQPEPRHLPLAQASGGQRPLGGAGHPGVTPAFQPLIERHRPGDHQRRAQKCVRHRRPQRRIGRHPGRNGHRQQHQGHDSRSYQTPIIHGAPVGLFRPPRWSFPRTIMRSPTGPVQVENCARRRGSGVVQPVHNQRTGAAIVPDGRYPGPASHVLGVRLRSILATQPDNLLELRVSGKHTEVSSTLARELTASARRAAPLLAAPDHALAAPTVPVS